MSHPFGDLLSQHLHRKHGLSQSKLAEGILQDPSIIGKMCKGQRLTGPQARGRVLDIIHWLSAQAALETVVEANAMLAAAGMAALRIDDSAEAEMLRQLRTEPVSTAAPSTPPVPRTNLPAALTSLVGREHDLAHIAHLVAAHRLVTLTGAGGVGKTRLAIEVGSQWVRQTSAHAFADGVWMVELAPLAQPTLIAQTIARLFKLPEQTHRAPLEVLQAYLADRHLLLILDNCEHLVDACAEIVVHLLHHCWSLHILTTSREELRIPGEVLYSVPPLALPDSKASESEDMLDCGAAQLLVDRMRMVQPTVVIQPADRVNIARICRHLDGMPLALELAAPLTRNMSLAEIADQLHNQMAILINSYRTIIPRHQTMHRALAWSYRLLAPHEQQVLASLSVFAGGWTGAAAEAVCVDTTAASLKVILQHLVSTSWLLSEHHNEQRRFRFLEPVRQFAHAQLVACGELDEMRRRHAAYFLALAEQAESELQGPDQIAWLNRLEQDHDNLRTALAWAVDHDLEVALRLAGALTDFWFTRGWRSEGRQWLTSALARVDTPICTPVELGHLATPLPPVSTAARAKALYGAGFLAEEQEDDARAEALFVESLALARALNDSRRIALPLYNLGELALDQGDAGRATALFTEGLAVTRSADNRSMIALLLFGLGRAAWAQGDLQSAASCLAESLTIRRALDDQRNIARGLRMLGELMLEQGNVQHAAELFAEALSLARSVGDPGNTAWLLYHLGRFVLERHDLADAVTRFAASARLFQIVGFAQGVAMSLTGLATIRVQQRKLAQAVPALSMAAKLWAHATSSYWVANERAEHEQAVEAVRTLLDATTFAQEWKRGQAMTLEQVITCAFEEDSGGVADLT